MYLTIAKWVGGVLLGLMVAWIVYAGLIRPTTKPNPSTSQNADSIVNYTYSPRLTFGCQRFDLIKEVVK
jgi:flagellar biosynthesis/type III secretory pathway M-ring protein FliF/YscJ